jgi:dephospho-CoA kinase
VLSADAVARDVVVPDSPILAEVAMAFGPGVLHADGTLDRAALAAIVFSDSDARGRLESITHPAILSKLREQIDAARRAVGPAGVVAAEVPLLYESGIAGWFDRIVVVTASQPVRVARMLARDGISEAEAIRRIEAQWPLDRKAELADDVVVNNGSTAELAISVEALWRRLRAA